MMDCYIPWLVKLEPISSNYYKCSITGSFSNSRYPGTTFMDHILRYQDNSAVKMIALLGEVTLIYIGVETGRL